MIILHFDHKKSPNGVCFQLLSPATPSNTHTQHQPLPRSAPPPHPVSKLGHASQPTAHTFLSSSSFWTLIHLWSDSVLLALQGIQDYCTYRAVASRRVRRAGGADRGVESGEDKGIFKEGMKRRMERWQSGFQEKNERKKNDNGEESRLFFSQCKSISFAPPV